MKKCLIYARVSTDTQETANQIAQLRAYAARQEWEILDVVEDICSGGKAASERNGLTRVFDLAHKKRFDVLLFWSLDRLSREGTRMTIHYIQRLEDCGVDWHSFAEPYISSLGIFKDAIIAILSALAKQERLRLSERTKAGLERARRNGSLIGRPKTPVARIEEARRLRSQGLSFTEIGTAMGVARSRAHQLVVVGQQQGGAL